MHSYDAENLLDQWYSTFFSLYTPQIQFLFNFVPPKLLVYNLSYTQSIIKMQNKLSKLHLK
jgi:hypothetical protein